jgi:YVTN family beta-propeller protein
MFDSKTMMPMKTVEVQGNPDGMLIDAAEQRVYVLSHAAPHVTAIDAKDGTVIGTVDIGGMPEQAATDGKGHVYIDVEDKENIAVVDAKTLRVARARASRSITKIIFYLRRAGTRQTW